MYHTQEKWLNRLINPIICTNPTAWLGNGYYFWDDEIDAVKWGNTSKTNTGRYEIYRADIDCEDILDTVFNEEHYRFWFKQIEKAAKSISKKTGLIASKREINQYFLDKASWSEVTGIMFQDIPKGAELLVQSFYYRKRIQLVVYNPIIIANFALHLEDKCV